MYHESQVVNVELHKPKIRFIPNIVYSQVETMNNPNELLQMDILLPQVAGKMPTIIFVTGGGFIYANRARMPQLRFFFAERNFVVASINYRTVPNSAFPAPIEDVKSAIRFLKAHADKLNIDSEKIFLIGDSAGGYLTAFAAVTNDDKIFNVGENLNQSSKICAAVDLYGVLELDKLADFPQMCNSLGNMPIEKANPINYIEKKSAPMLLMHGTADNIVPPEHTEKLFQALKNAGIYAERYLVENANHADEYWQQDAVFEIILKFFRRYL